jgi:hypothetical protein
VGLKGEEGGAVVERGEDHGMEHASRVTSWGRRQREKKREYRFASGWAGPEGRKERKGLARAGLALGLSGGEKKKASGEGGLVRV